MKNLRFNKFFLLSALLGSQFASASVVLLSDERSVSNVASLGAPLTTTTTSTPFSHWVVPGQDSQVTTDFMGGSGSGFIDNYYPRQCFPLPCAQVYQRQGSEFRVSFRVDQAQTLQFDATLTAHSPSSGNSGGGPENFSVFHLDGPTGFNDLYWLVVGEKEGASDPDIIGHGSASISYLIDLIPGVYTLSVSASHSSQVQGVTTSAWSFQAQFPATVPVPAAGWLLVSALGSLGIARKLRRKD